jgi:hypothetical protein
LEKVEVLDVARYPDCSNSAACAAAKKRQRTWEGGVRGPVAKG